MEEELFDACIDGNITKIIKLIDYGVDINAKNECGWTPLLIASHRNCKEICEILLSKGADINIKNQYGYTALDEAIYNCHGRYDICKLLTDNGGEACDLNLKIITSNGLIDFKWADLCLKVIGNRAWNRRKHMIAMFKHTRKL